jgi:hypothetical protein
MMPTAKFDVLLWHVGTVLHRLRVNRGGNRRIRRDHVRSDELGLVCTTNALRVCHALHWLAVPRSSLATFCAALSVSIITRAANSSLRPATLALPYALQSF